MMIIIIMVCTMLNVGCPVKSTARIAMVLDRDMMFCAQHTHITCPVAGGALKMAVPHTHTHTKSIAA